ncbi:MAG TPA: hypothetical protein DDY71_16675 [Spirochaetia bacterium]|nr:MAG: hypothetical protein A2Y29_15445 [Spirochaetes bacterium GWE2_31_10]HBD94606.1 hypothetical protein [Spirochaetia bacterium]HBI39278.1 hypothetical protein [Spirochaetia bacterium]
MNLINYYEELSFSEWPSHETLFYDNWIIRISDGYTKRANSINTIYGNGEVELYEKLNFCEDLFHKANIKPTFKLTILDQNKYLDSILEKRGYEIVEPSVVMKRDLDLTYNISNLNYQIFSNLDINWLDEFAKVKKMNNQDRSNFQIISEKISGIVFHIILKDNNNDIVSLGTGAIQRNQLGILNIHTVENSRSIGYGSKLMNIILSEGVKFGAKASYLQVVKNNKAASKLYTNLGYSEVYEYWYRVKS